MSDEIIDQITNKEYEFGFVTPIESDKIPAGLNEDVIRLLGIKTGTKVSIINPPPGFVSRMNPLPDGVEFLVVEERVVAGR